MRFFRVLVCMLLLSSYAYSADPMAVISGVNSDKPPAAGVTGRLLVFSSEASSADTLLWQFDAIERVAEIYVCNSGTTAIVNFVTPGEHTFSLLAMSVNETPGPNRPKILTHSVKHTVKVVGDNKKDTPITPKPDDPVVDVPKVPEEEDKPGPFNDKFGFYAHITAVAKTVQLDKKLAKAMGLSYIARSLRKYDDIQKLVLDQKAENQTIVGTDVAGLQVLQAVTAKLIESAKAGKIATLADHGQVWLEIGSALNDYSK